MAQIDIRANIDDGPAVAALERLANKADEADKAVTDIGKNSNIAFATLAKEMEAATSAIEANRAEVVNLEKQLKGLKRSSEAAAKAGTQGYKEKAKAAQETSDLEIKLLRARITLEGRANLERLQAIKRASKASEVQASEEQVRIRELEGIRDDASKNFIKRARAANEILKISEAQQARQIELAEAELAIRQQQTRAIGQQAGIRSGAYQLALEREQESLIELNKLKAQSTRALNLQGKSAERFSATAGVMRKATQLVSSALKTAFITTGIGALIGVAAALVNGLRKIKPVADAISDAFAGVSAAVNAVVERASGLGSAFSAIFSGDIRGGLAQIGTAFQGIGSDIAQASSEAVKLNQDLRALAEAEEDIVLARAKNQEQLVLLKAAAEDETASIGQRANAQRQLSAIERNDLNEQLRLARERLRIVDQQAEATKQQRTDARGNLRLTADQQEAQRAVFDLQAQITQQSIDSSKAENDLRKAAVERVKAQREALADLEKQTKAFLDSVDALERSQLSGIERIRAERELSIRQLEEKEQALRAVFRERGVEFNLEADLARAKVAINRQASKEISAILAEESANRRKELRDREEAELSAADKLRQARLSEIDATERLLLARAELSRKRSFQTEEEFLISSEREKLNILIGTQKLRLKVLEEQFGPNSPEVQLVRTQIQLLQQEYEEAGNISVAPFEALKQKVLKALNVTEEELAEVLSSAGEAIGAISQLIDAGIQQQLAQQDTLIDSIKGRISETEKLLAEEQRAQEQGFANNVSLYEQSLAEEKRLLEQAEEERAKLQEKQTKRQARQNQLQAASEYALLVIKLLSAEAGKGGLVGIALAIGGLALIAKVVAEQKRVAAKLTEPGFRDGTPYVDGPGTGRSDSITARLSKGERIITARGNAELGGRAMSEREVIDFFKLGRVVAQQGFPITAPDAGRAAREAKEATKEKELQMLQQQREIAKEAALEVVRAIKDQPVSIPMPKGTLVKQGNKETWYRQEE